MPRSRLLGAAQPNRDHAHSADGAIRPYWNANDRELWYGTLLVLVFERSAPHLERIVTVFEEEDWRRTIDDPLPGAPRQQAHQRLRDAVRHLNEKQPIPVLGFHVVKDGTAIRWELVLTPGLLKLS